MPRAIRITPFADPRERFAAGRFGMWLFLASLAMLFAASILGYLVIRWQMNDPKSPGIELPPLPAGLWFSTLILITSSVSMQGALVAARTNSQALLRAMMLLTLLLGLAFLGVQGLCWMQMIHVHMQMESSLADVPRYAIASFYVLTALHAAHVVGGLTPMVIVSIRAMLGRYGPDRHAGVEYLAMYWHFLGVVWIVLFAVLLLGR